jgi:cytidylate kinase
VPARSRPIVAIDGPAGAGKSTVSRDVATALGFLLVDTGAMYRAIALAAQRAGVAWDDGPKLGALARAIVLHRDLRYERGEGGAVAILLHGDDVTDAVRTPQIGLGASVVSAHPDVREALLGIQREAGRDGGVVLEGRDIGTVVFPDAEAKFFLTAKPAVRARRRFEELQAKGQTVTYEETLRDVIARDTQDENRAVAPLRRAEDAVEIDCSSLSAEQTVALIVARVNALGR